MSLNKPRHLVKQDEQKTNDHGHSSSVTYGSRGGCFVCACIHGVLSSHLTKYWERELKVKRDFYGENVQQTVKPLHQEF